MSPDRSKVIGKSKVEEFYWNSKMVVYIDNKLTNDTFELACDKVQDFYNNAFSYIFPDS